MSEQLLAKILQRRTSFFAQDVQENREELKDKISNSRMLIIGAAGSVGSAFVKEVMAFSPSAVHLMDINENNLVEVVRDLRSSDLDIPDDFKTFAVGLGTVESRAFLKNYKDYDYYLNFSALKHVRSERDPYTLMRMVHTNVSAVKELLDSIENNSVLKFFSVSSDKAVRPVSIMGATKKFMEDIMLLYSDKTPCSTARFANVAFSDGSLLYGFNKRIEKRQPFSGPADVKRFFISHEEAGSICLLSCFLGHNRDNFFPKLKKDLDMHTFPEIAKMFLETKGLKPLLLHSEQEAKSAMSKIGPAAKEWPCFFSESDTSGEKMYEEFFTEEDTLDLNRYHHVGIIHQKALEESKAAVLTEVLEDLQKIREKGQWSKNEIVKSLKRVIPEMQHEEKEKNLDQKM